MPFEEKLPEWNAPGIEPPASKKNMGWQAGEKPPADYWNWQMNRTYKALQELQQKAAEKTEIQQVQQTANEAKATADAAQSDLSAHASATTGVHGATSAATPNTLVQRDSAGRAKVAAPAASDDIARKDTVDAVQTSLNNHKSSAVLDHPDGSVTSAKLADGSVISAKLASGAVTSAKLANGAATDTAIGNRTISDTSAPTGDTGTPTNLWSWLAYMIKSITGKSSWRSAPATTLEAAASHISNTSNPHGVTKSQVGLGNVQNYGIASQAQAEAGTANNVYMTPQRSKQYVDTRLLNDLKFRVNGNKVEAYYGGGWKTVGFDPRNMTYNLIMQHNASNVEISAGGYVNVLTISGAGVIAEVQILMSSNNSASLGASLVIDGVEKNLYSYTSSTTFSTYVAGYNSLSGYQTAVFNFKHLIPFSSSLVIRMKNLGTTSINAKATISGGYYT